MMPARRADVVKLPAATSSSNRSPSSRNGTQSLEVLFFAAIGDAVRNAVADAIAEVTPAEPAPALLDRRALAQRLSISESVLDRLRREPGFPTVWITEECPRFDPNDVLPFVKSRGAR
jgi:hypothetical protein